MSKLLVSDDRLLGNLVVPAFKNMRPAQRCDLICFAGRGTDHHSFVFFRTTAGRALAVLFQQSSAFFGRARGARGAPARPCWAGICDCLAAGRPALPLAHVQLHPASLVAFPGDSVLPGQIGRACPAHLFHAAGGEAQGLGSDVRSH